MNSVEQKHSPSLETETIQKPAMKYTLGVCKCNYRMLIADEQAATPQDLRALRKKAKRARFHFAVNPKVCPNCGEPIDLSKPNTLIEASGLDAPEISAAIGLIDAYSEGKRALGVLIKGLKTMADELQAQTKSVCDIIAFAKGNGATPEEVPQLIETTNLLRAHLTVFVDAIDAAASVQPKIETQGRPND